MKYRRVPVGAAPTLETGWLRGSYDLTTIPGGFATAGLLGMLAGYVEEQNVPTTAEIQEKVIQIVSEQMSADKVEISRNTSFVNDLNADSLDTVELVMELEDEFDLTIPDEEAEKLKTVGEAIDFIQKHVDGK